MPSSPRFAKFVLAFLGVNSIRGLVPDRSFSPIGQGHF